MSKEIFFLDDQDVFPGKKIKPKSSERWKNRKTVRIILLNANNKIGLLSNNVHKYLSFPGGGVESGESFEDAVLRECQEETGFSCNNLQYLTISKDIRKRDKRKLETHCFVCNVGKAVKEDLRTDMEKRTNIQIEWVDLKKVINIFE